MKKIDNTDEPAFECERCGLCCIDFSSQIKYKINPVESNWLKLDEFYRKIILNFNDQELPKKACYPFHINRKNSLSRPNSVASIKYINSVDARFLFIPTKIEYLAYLLKKKYVKMSSETIAHEFHKILLKYSGSKKADECLFLTEDNGIFSCTINENHPEMCDNYPKNKGFACLNQKSRYFTKTYLKHKIELLKLELDLLNQVFPYFSDHNLDSLLLIALLMDFGDFEYEKVENFFINQIGWDGMEFKYAVKDLQRFGLLFGTMRNKIRIIESISSNSLKKKIKNAFE